MNTEINNFIQQLDVTIKFFIKEFNSINVGKTSPTILDGIIVEVYESKKFIKELSSLTTPNANSIKIEPWDKSIINNIIKAILKANIGLNPIVNGNIIICPIPPLSNERRITILKFLKKVAENYRIKIRSIRRDYIEKIRKEFKGQKDYIIKLEKKIQELTLQYINKIEDKLIEKEKELIK